MIKFKLFNFVKKKVMTTLTLLMPHNLTPFIIIAIVVLLLFGGKKIPELMKGLGSGIKEFKNSVKDDEKPSEAKKTENTNVNN